MKLIYKLLFFIVLFGLLTVQSCGVNSNLMFKQAKGDVINDSIPLTPVNDYRISPDDKVAFSLSANNGSGIIEKITGISKEENNGVGAYSYMVRKNGEIDIPVIGSVHVAGLTIEECEDTLASLYGAEYKDPFVQVQVTNQRVIVFPGNGSDATVVPLKNANTTLMEALASAGGITERGKASTVKLMRKVNGKREIYVMDLSTVEGLKYVDLIVQANDYIYVEPSAELAKEVVKDVAPIMSLISSALIIFSVFNLIK